MKTVLVRAYAACNLGDDLFLKVLVERYPEVKFRIIGSKLYSKLLRRYPNVEIAEDPLTVFINRVILKLLGFISIKKKDDFILYLFTIFYRKEVKLSDGFLYIGGSIFMQSGENITLADTINKMISEVFNKKSKFIVGANFGPYFTNSYVDFYRSLFEDFEDVCFREYYSKSVFNDLHNVRVCPDVVFQLKVSKIDKIANSVGFSLIDLSFRKQLSKFEDDYLMFVDQIIKEVLYSDGSVYLFSFCKSEGDEDVISKVISNLPIVLRNKISIVYYDGDIDEFLNHYAKVESMFSTRFHSMVLSSLFDQNVFPIVYSKKMTNILNDFNYKGFSSEIAELKDLQASECLKNIKESRLTISSSDIELSKNSFSVFENFLVN